MKSVLDIRCGRSEFICIVSKLTKQAEFYENPYKASSHSGVKLVDWLVNHNVDTVITGEVGPNIKELLEKAKIRIILIQDVKSKIGEIADKLLH